jgi:hypothetical protein
MEFLLELILGRFIIRFLGVNIRYQVLKIFDESLKKQDLLGKSKDVGAEFGNDIINAGVGLLALFLFFYLGNLFF